MSDLEERVLRIELKQNQIYGGFLVASVALLGFFGFTNFYQIPKAAKNAVPDAVRNYIDKEQDGIIEGIRTVEAEVKQSAADAAANLAVIQDKARVASDLVANLDSSSGVLLAETGVVRIHNKDQPELLNPVKCETGVYRGTTKRKQEFTVPFSSPPSVAIALSWLELDKHQHTRLVVRVEEGSITKKSFEYSFRTYCNSRVFGADASWVALGN